MNIKGWGFGYRKVMEDRVKVLAFYSSHEQVMRPQFWDPHIQTPIENYRRAAILFTLEFGGCPIIGQQVTVNIRQVSVGNNKISWDFPTVRQGNDLVIYATGIMTALALETAAILAGEGIDAAVLNVPTIKPLDAKTVIHAAKGKQLAVTMEEHWISGGLGSAVSEVLAETRDTPALLRIGVNDAFGQSATAAELLQHYGLTPDQMSVAILNKLKVDRRR